MAQTAAGTPAGDLRDAPAVPGAGDEVRVHKQVVVLRQLEVFVLRWVVVIQLPAGRGAGPARTSIVAVLTPSLSFGCLPRGAIGRFRWSFWILIPGHVTTSLHVTQGPCFAILTARNLKCRPPCDQLLVDCLWRIVVH